MIKTIDTNEVTKEMMLAFHKIVSVSGLGVLYNFEDAVREMLSAAPAVESVQSELLEVVIAMRDWIDAVPQDLQLPTMPGFDRDWADAVIADAQKGKQAQSVAEPVSKEWDSLGSIGNRLHNISVEQHYAGNEKLSDELGEFASLLWIWERTRKPTVPPAIPADLRSKVLELCETIIDAEDCGALVDDVMDFNLPRQIREMMGEA